MAAPAALSLAGVRKSYGDLAAVDGLDLEVRVPPPSRRRSSWPSSATGRGPGPTNCRAACDGC